MDHFAQRENIKLISSRLESELHANVRSQLHKLLLEEERRLGADLEFLAELEQTIISFDALIDTQERLVTMLELNGDGERQRAILNGFRKTRELCQRYRQKIVAAHAKTVQ